MSIRAKILQDIIEKINQLPENRLIEILNYVNNFEDLSESQKFFLSFAGKWHDMDQTVLLDLTENLHQRRKNDMRQSNIHLANDDIE